MLAPIRSPLGTMITWRVVQHGARPLLRWWRLHSRYVTTRHGRIHYYDSHPDGGPRQASLMVHGIGSSSLSLVPVALQLAHVSRMILPDLPHFAGLSKCPRPLLRTHDYVDIIAEMIRTLGLPPVDLCGHSLGGGASIHLAGRYPESVRSLGLMNPAGFRRGFDRLRAQFITSDTKVEAGFLAPLTQGELGEKIKNYLASISPKDFVDRSLGLVRCPTLVLWGEDDALYDLKYPQYLLRKIRGSSLVLIPGAGHLVPQEAPSLVAKGLATFWQGLSELTTRQGSN